MAKKDILNIESLASFEKLINKDHHPYDIDMMVMPGTLEDKHKNVDPEKGIPALRRQFNLIYILLDGDHDVLLGADYRWLKHNDLVLVPEGMVYASKNIRQCKGYCIHFKTDFIQPLIKSSFTDEFSFFSLEAEHIINLSNDDCSLLQQSFRDIINEYNRFSYEKDYLLRNYIHILLLRIREIYKPHLKKVEQTTQGNRIANRFKHLVEKEFREMRNVSDYADALNVSPAYLSEVVSNTLGRTPKRIISEMLLLEAKVLLKSTDQTVTEIAHSLKFQDQSHFSHFIKRLTDKTPAELRKSL